MRKLLFTRPDSTFAQACRTEIAYEKIQKRIRNNLILFGLLVLLCFAASALGHHLAALTMLAVSLLPLHRASKIQHDYDMRRL